MTPTQSTLSRRIMSRRIVPGGNRWLPRLTVAAWCLLLVVMTGCAGYQVGTRSLYAPDIQTVYVPIFESDSFRRNLGERLTEAVVKEIELKTPYKVVNTPMADSILTGRLRDQTKHVLVESARDQARQSEIDFRVDVAWQTNRGDMIHPPMELALAPELISFGQSATYVPEGGQSNVSSQHQAITRLAEQIVSTMEMPW